MRGSHGFLRTSSCCSFRGYRVSEFGGGNESDEEDESGADKEEGIEFEDPDEAFGSSLLPGSWDVLGLGQAMVI